MTTADFVLFLLCEGKHHVVLKCFVGLLAEGALEDDKRRGDIMMPRKNIANDALVSIGLSDVGLAELANRLLSL